MVSFALKEKAHPALTDLVDPLQWSGKELPDEVKLVAAAEIGRLYQDNVQQLDTAKQEHGLESDIPKQMAVSSGKQTYSLLEKLGVDKATAEIIANRMTGQLKDYITLGHARTV